MKLSNVNDLDLSLCNLPKNTIRIIKKSGLGYLKKVTKGIK